ncbi:Uncharacterised protein [Legionella lansingensis]|uniref:Lipocalin-like domain-containing protein n=1 Tax=Legionella lansingensis TaxID=45067 RepID=A0A0W0VTR3_9GAMM|nr:hypothetical protein [Legionella lansingensis]KTD23457.1 hypothetical protein Llan_0828 [Legionella lansingensis]SNV50848.1 Uncharacterised protein [Legionella lansingensis]
MKTAIALLLSCAFSSLTIAATPSIIGTWSGKSDLINWEGKHETVDYQLKFTEMKNNYVTGVASWKAEEGKKYSVGKEHHGAANEKFIGTYDEKSNTYFLVETTEHSFLKVKPQANGEIHVIYLESGERAVVFNGVLKKQ